ncbi:MAG: hypothetical protein HN712_06035 [Gemmatimonadetes bacterium]|jgi:Tol biopolymer transport system component|nr:hypothetical protein [Gemmatimonadota bacterium]MBT6143822.1 hypothetical protein [Gemmatimonadota bacterium]MBT7859851.1 hypothetical protein [Gemmatimonadota bacterium]
MPLRPAILVLALAGGLSAQPGQIAFSTNQHVLIMNTDGTGVRQLAKGQSPAWSPDGERIVFVTAWSREQGATNISVMDRDGSNAETLFEGDGLNPSNPAFSHDGRKILFSSWQDEESFIYEMDATPGATAHQIPLFPSNSEDPTFLYSPAVSPDGMSLAFILMRRSQIAARSTGDLYLSNLDGSNGRLVAGDIGSHDAPAWSPGGELAFYSKRQDGEGIYIADGQGSNQTLLSVEWVIDWDPSWSPDGEWISFASSQSRKGIDIFIMRRDGTDVVNLTNTPDTPDYAPAWSPVALPRLETPILEPSWGQLKTDLPGPATSK